MLAVVKVTKLRNECGAFLSRPSPPSNEMYEFSRARPHTDTSERKQASASLLDLSNLFKYNPSWDILTEREHKEGGELAAVRVSNTETRLPLLRSRLGPTRAQTVPTTLPNYAQWEVRVFSKVVSKFLLVQD